VFSILFDSKYTIAETNEKQQNSEYSIKNNENKMADSLNLN